MKRLSVTYANGFTEEFTAAKWYEAKQVQNYPGTRFFLKGDEVTAEVWFADVAAHCEKAFDKKNETHKRVRVLHGASVACYVEKWVRR